MDNISARLWAKYEVTGTDVEDPSASDELELEVDELDNDTSSHHTDDSVEANPEGSKGGHDWDLDGVGDVVSEKEEVDELASSSVESEPGA